MRLIVGASVSLFALCATGCVIVPVYKTVKPAMQVTVVADSMEPVANATVSLMTTAYPYGHETETERLKTDDRGVVAFAGESDLRTEMPLMLHGSTHYAWTLGVQREGFDTHWQTVRPGWFGEQLTIKLLPGRSSSCTDAARRILNKEADAQRR